jgi:hypothetical protein
MSLKPADQIFQHRGSDSNKHNTDSTLIGCKAANNINALKIEGSAKIRLNLKQFALCAPHSFHGGEY